MDSAVYLWLRNQTGYAVPASGRKIQRVAWDGNETSGKQEDIVKRQSRYVAHVPMDPGTITLADCKSSLL